MMIDRHAILATLDTLLGVPFLHQGRTHAGLDCLGVVMFVAQAHGVPLQDMQGYAAATDSVLLTQECQRQLIEIPVSEAVPADLVQWADLTGPLSPPCNLAFLGWRNGHVTMVHAWLKMGCVCEHDLSRPWPQMVKRAYSLPEIGAWAPIEGETAGPE